MTSPLTINVNAANKIVPTGAPTRSKTTLDWGEQLSTITLSGAMKDGDTEVKGTFAWTNSATTPSDMNDFEAEWKFTPENTDVYAEITDTVTIKVIKATPHRRAQVHRHQRFRQDACRCGLGGQ